MKSTPTPVGDSNGRIDQFRPAVSLHQVGNNFRKDHVTRTLRLAERDVAVGRHRVQLYRFLTDTIPVVDSCVWTWIRLAASKAPSELSNILHETEI